MVLRLAITIQQLVNFDDVGIRLVRFELIISAIEAKHQSFRLLAWARMRLLLIGSHSFFFADGDSTLTLESLRAENQQFGVKTTFYVAALVGLTKDTSGMGMEAGVTAENSLIHLACMSYSVIPPFIGRLSVRKRVQAAQRRRSARTNPPLHNTQDCMLQQQLKCTCRM